METAVTISRANQSHISCVRVRGRANIFCADQGFWSEWTQDCFSGMELKVNGVSFIWFIKPVWVQVLMVAQGICCPGTSALEVGCWISFTFNLLQHNNSCSFASAVHLEGEPQNINASAAAPFPAAWGQLGWRSDCWAREGTGTCSFWTGHPSGCPAPQISSSEPLGSLGLSLCVLSLLQGAEGRGEALSSDCIYVPEI